MVVSFHGSKKRRQKFPEKKIFQFFRSTNHYSKHTSLIAAATKTMWWTFLSPKSLGHWTFLAKLSFYKLSEPLLFEMTRATWLFHKSNRNALLFEFLYDLKRSNIKLIVVSINACFNHPELPVFNNYNTIVYYSLKSITQSALLYNSPPSWMIL